MSSLGFLPLAPSTLPSLVLNLPAPQHGRLQERGGKASRADQQNLP